MECIIKISNLNKFFGKKHVLRDLNFKVYELDRIAIIGGNGAGKTTLLKILSLNDKKYTGELFNKFKKSEISFHFQSIDYQKDHTIYELLYMFMNEKEVKEIDKKIEQQLNSIDLLEFKNDFPSNLSGGQLQKFNLLLTLATKPKLIFLDEILAGLDVESVKQVLNFVKKNINNKITSITTSHNSNEIFETCKKIFILKKGKLISEHNIDEFKNVFELEKLMKNSIEYDGQIEYEKLIKHPKKNFILNEKNSEIKLRGITKTYKLLDVLVGKDNEGIDLNIDSGEQIAIIGRNGSGKSTLVEIISGTKKETDGKIIFNLFEENSKFHQRYVELNKEISSIKNDENKIKEIKSEINSVLNKNSKKISKIRSYFIGIQFQKQYFPRMLTIRDIIIYNLRSNGIKYDENYIDFILESIDLLPEKYNNSYQLSGGQRQKLNIILTILKRPHVLILDELTTGLDLIAKQKLLNLIKEYITRENPILIMVTHSLEDINVLAKKIIVIKDGKISKKIDFLDEDKTKILEIFKEL